MIEELLSISLVMQLFALLNPLSSFPILIAAYEKRMNVKRIAVNAVITAFVIAIFITLTGPILFNLFSITLDSFRIAGGVILLLLGLHTVRPSDVKHSELSGIGSTISIIATPMLTGPATISFITIKTYEIGYTPVLVNLLFAFLLVGIVFVVFAHAVARINRKIIDIVSRVLGLFLTAVGIEMIARGISGLFGMGM
ncbi:MarC family protein [Candidatus Woesearchaeota archaeon]|nr:MarC family protein [Candidatus Woesearchaeota archaeon]